MRTCCWLLVIGGLISAFTLGPASAAEYVVLPDGSGDFPTIQAAIDAAVDGDQILLAYGRFTGPGNRSLSYGGKAITVRGLSSDPENTIIDCEGSHTNYCRGVAFDGEGTNSVLQGVTIERGYVDGSPDDDFGGGILFENGASPTLIDVVIRNCGALGGGGFWSFSCSPHFIRCRFENGGACGGGGGYANGGSPVFTDCDFVGGFGLQGGGGLGIASCSATFSNCRFVNNEIDGGFGAGLRILWSTAVVTGCTFINNSVLHASGARCVPPPGMMPDGRELEQGGGAIGIYDSVVTVSGCTMVGNATADNLGGAIVLVGNDASLNLENSILAFNTGGGALVCDPATATISVSCTDIHSNVGGDWTGCIAGLAGMEGNISLDPLFCNLMNNDLRLQPESPCAPEHSGGCGLIGAWPATCDEVSGADPVSTSGSLQLRMAPNPTIGTCRVEMRSLTASPVRLTITDVAGRLVKEFPQAQLGARTAGCAILYWDGLDSAGRAVSSGIYFVRAQTTAGRAVRALVVSR